MRPVFKKCPICGSRKIRLVEGDYATTARGKRIKVPGVRRHQCPSCGEVLLDYKAVKQIEARRFDQRKVRQLARIA